MARPNGLARRLERTERCEEGTTTLRELFREEFARQISERADRLQGRPGPPIEQQPPIERCIRAALEEVEGVEGRTRVMCFWDTFVAAMRAARQEHER